MDKSNQMKKIAIIGCGFVGSTIAYSLTNTVNPDEIVLIDTNFEKSKAEALDISKGLNPLHDVKVYSGDFCDIVDSNLIVITAGRNRKAGEDRNDLLKDNLIISKNIAFHLKKYYSGCPILIVANPVDILVYAYSKWLNQKSGVVFGTGCSLDSLRLSAFLSDYLNVSTKEIEPCIIGEHGNNFAVIWRHTKISGTPISKYCKENKVLWSREIEKQFENKTKRAGMEIIMGKGKTQFGIAIAVSLIAKSVLFDEKNNFSVSSAIDFDSADSIGYNIAFSMPSIVGKNGKEKTIDLNLNTKERSLLLKAIEKMDEIIKECEI